MRYWPRFHCSAETERAAMKRDRTLRRRARRMRRAMLRERESS